MRKGAIALFIGVLGLTACAPSVVVVTATPVPPTPTPLVIVVTATPVPATFTPLPTSTPIPTSTPLPTNTATATKDPTPTREVTNPHAACLLTGTPETCPANANPYLDGPYSTRLVDGRTVQAPADWTIIRNGGLPTWPNVLCAGGDCTISADSLSGRIGMRSGGAMIYGGQRYLIVSRFSVQCNSSQASRDTFRPYITLYTSGPAAVYTSIEGTLQRTSGYNEALWVVETDKRLSDLIIEAWFHVPFGVCGQNSALTWHSIELLPVPSDYGGNSVTRF